MAEPRQGGPAGRVATHAYRRRRTALASVTLVLLVILIVTLSGRDSARHRPRPSAIAGSPAALRPRLKASALRRIEALGYAHIRQLARLGLPVYCGGRRGNEVAFTFDDGPGPYTYMALRRLRAAGERATFFVVGRSMSNFPHSLHLERAVAAIGDHTYNHPDLQLLANTQIKSEIVTTERMIEAEIGQRPYLFRPPYGARDARVDGLVKRLGLLGIMWSMDSRDSLGANSRGVIRNVEAGLRPGAIILFHENHGQTIHALPTLLSLLHKRHLRSVSLPELFATDPPSVAQVRRGLDGCGPRIVPPVLRGG